MKKDQFYKALSFLCLLAFVAAPVSADGGLPTWPSNPDWQNYVPGPSSDDVKPVAITRFHGNVTNPEALLGRGGVATLTVQPGGQNAVIVLDYGQEVGGTPYIVVDSTSGSNSVRISTSEALPFLNSNSTTSLARDAAAGQTNVKVANAAPFYAGTTITIDSGAAAETRTVTDVGTAAGPDTSLVLPAAVGDTNVKVASVNGYAVGGPLAVGSEQATITAVGTAAGAPTTIVYPVSAGDTNVKVASVSGFAPGQKVLIDTGAGMEVRTTDSIGTPATTTSLFGAASADDTNIKVTSVSGLAVGNEIDIEPGASQDHVTITSVGTAGLNTTVSVANTTFGLPTPTIADANWIWNTPGASSSAPSGTIYVRKTFNVADASAVTSAALRIAVDDEHDTYVNGTFVTSLHIANGWRTSNVVDIKPLLVDGTNVVAVAATNGSGAGSMIAAFDIDASHVVSDATWKALPGTPPSPPDGWNTAAFDDSGWVAANVSGLYGIGPWNQNVSEPPGPTTLRVTSRTDFAVGDQISIGAGADQEIRTVAFASGTGTSQQLTVDSPLTIVHNPGTPVLDLSKPGSGIDFTPALANAHDALVTVASPGSGITFASALVNDHPAGAAIRGAGSGIDFTPALTGGYDAGTTVSSAGTGITFSPALTAAHAAGATVTGIGTYINDNGAQINFIVDSAQTYTGGLRGGFRYAAIELRSAGTVTLSGTGLNFKAYRATPAEYEGWFISSDDQLNRMWYAGAYTAQMDMVPVGVAACFTKPVIFDGAKRDRAIWSGDLLISDPVALLSLGSNAAPYVTGSIDAFIDLQAANGRLTSAVGFRGCGAFDYAVTYSNYSAMIAIQYYRYTGDTAYITNLLPKLEAATAYAASRLDANGLIVTNDNDYWQTRQDGEVTEYNLAYYELLRDMIWLESHIGTPEKVAEYTDAAAALKDAINSRLFNEEAGLYQHTDSRPNVFPLDANMNAIKNGVAPADQIQHILDYFKAAWVEHGSEISQPAPSMADPFGHTIEPLNNTWEMFARLQSNDAAGALELMRRLWGLQVDPNSGYFTNTLWEFVLANGLPSRGFDSLAHAWGAGPTQVLTEAVIGATPIDPGYETFQVKPQPVDIEWAQGQVPTAFGPTTVKWAQDTGTGMFHLEVNAPAGTGGEVWVPLLGGFAKALTPGPVFLRNDSDFAVYQVGSGLYEFESRPDTVAPTISGAASPAPNAAGWNNSDVSVSFTCADDVSGVASCGPDQTLSSEGAGHSVTGTAVDNSGNSTSTTVDINLDKTPPSVEVTGVSDGAAYTIGAVPAAGCTTTDSLSGVATNATVQVTGGNGLGVGTFTASCSGASDIAGNPGATASISFMVDASLDTFNRANGRVGNSWTGLISTRFYKITSQKLDVQLGGPIVWKGPLDTTQEAFVTLSTIDSRSTSQGLLLKVQSGSTIPNSGAIAVVYDAKAKAVRVSTIRLGSGGAWTPYGNKPFTFADGDQLGARVLATGDVQVFKNGTLILTVTLNATDKTFFNSKGGRIGLWTIAAPNALFDDFGGGTVIP